METITPRSAWLLAGLVFTLLGCSHDSKRDNPFDPVLTPPVDVQVSDSTGVALIEWTPYEGQTDFSLYRVLRREKTLVEVDTLALITKQAQAAYADTSIQPERDYVYWIEVMNTAGFSVSSAELSVQSFTVAGVAAIATSSALGQSS